MVRGSHEESRCCALDAGARVSKSESFAKFDAVVGSVRTLIDGRVEFEWHLAKMREYAEGLFARAPWKTGDRVRLTLTPIINEKTAWGWLGCQHFLVKGALATVQDVDFREGKFVADVMFDDESWKGDGDVLHPRPADERHVFMFWEGDLERVS